MFLTFQIIMFKRVALTEIIAMVDADSILEAVIHFTVYVPKVVTVDVIHISD